MRSMPSWASARPTWVNFTLSTRPHVARVKPSVAPPATSRGRLRAGSAARRGPPGPETIRLTEGRTTASVIVTFSMPGEYLMLAQVDNFDANDSGTQDQCCWTNGYLRVTVR